MENAVIQEVKSEMVEDLPLFSASDPEDPVLPLQEQESQQEQKLQELLLQIAQLETNPLVQPHAFLLQLLQHQLKHQHPEMQPQTQPFGGTL